MIASPVEMMVSKHNCLHHHARLDQPKRGIALVMVNGNWPDRVEDLPLSKSANLAENIIQQCSSDRSITRCICVGNAVSHEMQRRVRQHPGTYTRCNIISFSMSTMRRVRYSFQCKIQHLITSAPTHRPLPGPLACISIQPDSSFLRTQLDAEPSPNVFTDEIVDEPECRSRQVRDVVEHSKPSVNGRCLAIPYYPIN